MSIKQGAELPAGSILIGDIVVELKRGSAGERVIENTEGQRPQCLFIPIVDGLPLVVVGYAVPSLMQRIVSQPVADWHRVAAQ